MSEHPVFPIAREFVDILDRLGIPYALMGGLAVRLWAIPRPTYDVDVTISALDEGVRRLFQALEDAGYVVPEDARRGWSDALAGMRKFAVRKFLDRDSWRVDVFLVTTEYQRAAFSRRRSAKLLGKDAWSLSPEDLILHKLIAGREKDLVDISEVLALTRDLDLGYMRHWASALGVLVALEDRLGRTPPP